MPMQPSFDLPNVPPATKVLRAKIAKLERPDGTTAWGGTPFGDPRIDACLPSGGLPRGRWHEIGGAGAERELPAAASGFTAALACRSAERGIVIWALQRDDLHPPGLQAFGLKPDRLIFVRAGKDADILAALESALRTRGVTAAIGEVGTVDLTAGKRLQLACERGGATGFLLRRQLYGAAVEEASAATTRWAIAPLPSETLEPGLGPPRWAVRLERSRGGRTGAWVMEAENATGHVRVVAELADHPMEADSARHLAGTAA
jgi:protein ImuA